MLALPLLICAWTFAPQESTQQETAPPEQASAQEDEADEPDELTLEEADARLPWRTGEIDLGKGMAKLTLPAAFRYLDPSAAQRVLEDVWGNPPSDPTWGMIFPADRGPFHEDSWAVVLRYEDEGHVDDGDASKIDYDDLMTEMRSGLGEENESRTKGGFATIDIVGWADRPHYDPAQHELFWAKELRFSDAPGNTLNYDVRLLGRKGVLSMNAVAGIEALPEVKAGMSALLGAVEFTDGNRYEQFDTGIDKLAAYGIGGLIAGKLALNAGLFKGLLALLIAGKKVVILVCAGAAAWFGKLFRSKKTRPAA